WRGMPCRFWLWHFASLPLSAISPSASLDFWLYFRLACAWVIPPSSFRLPQPVSPRARTLRSHGCYPVAATRDQVICPGGTVPARVRLRGRRSQALPSLPFLSPAATAPRDSAKLDFLRNPALARVN